MKKAFVFDLFGTLISVFEKHVYTGVIDEMSAALNMPYEDFYKGWSVHTHDSRMIGTFDSITDNIKYILKEQGLVRTESEIQKAVDIRNDFVQRSLEMHRESLFETLENIKARGFKIGLISDCSPDVPGAWKSVEFKKYFDSVIFSCEAGMKKPDPRIYKKSIDSLNVSFEECYYVGDGGSMELTGALKVGMHPILIKSRKDEKIRVYKKYVDEWAGERIYCLSELMEYK